jgi:hypothetical protein
MATTGHVGKAGHLAAMAEFLLRGYNTAMPEVDLGDDIFVVEDRRGQLWRIQVKTAIAQRTRKGYRAKFSVSIRQLATEKDPDLFFVFAVRLEGRWEFLLIPRQQLRDEFERHRAGSRSRDNILFTVRLTGQSVICAQRDWQGWRGNWSEWPEITNGPPRVSTPR